MEYIGDGCFEQGRPFLSPLSQAATQGMVLTCSLDLRKGEQQRPDLPALSHSESRVPTVQVAGPTGHCPTWSHPHQRRCAIATLSSPFISRGNTSF